MMSVFKRMADPRIESHSTKRSHAHMKKIYLEFDLSGITSNMVRNGKQIKSKEDNYSDFP